MAMRTEARAERIRRDLPPYGWYAFFNPYNLTLFGSAVLYGLLSGLHWVVVLASVAETLWMIFAPRSRSLRRVWFDPAFERTERAFAEARCKKKIGQLTGNDRSRVARLASQKDAIERLARDTRSLAVELLKGELVKLDALLEDFIDLALRASQTEPHAQAFDFGAFRRSFNFHEAQVKRFPAGDPRREVAEKNLSVLCKRRERYADLTRTIQVVRGQMELIEHTFRLLADEILTMASPREVGRRIDQLRVAVDAVRETTDDAYVIGDEELRIQPLATSK